MEDVTPELWEELRLDNAEAEYDLLGRDQAEEEAQGTSQVLDRFSGLSEAAGSSTTRRDTAIEEENHFSRSGSYKP